MVVVPAGAFTMGSPDSEEDRRSDESPQHVVTIAKPFAVGRLHVTVDQFAAFVRKTGYRASADCSLFTGDKFDLVGSWRHPGFAQQGSHPAVCLSINDAKAYVDWLAKQTRKPYRLLTEAEWEYAARGRTQPGAYSRYWFGDDEKDLCRHGNGADLDARREWAKRAVAYCHDGYAYTAPAGHYRPNAFGLYDMFGNAAQWTADCWHDSYDGAPADGSAWTAGDCKDAHVTRGGSWGDLPRDVRAAKRSPDLAAEDTIGLRVARTLAP
jgi:formylglycine-generating enzyme required for sulfatase activity